MFDEGRKVNAQVFIQLVEKYRDRENQNKWTKMRNLLGQKEDGAEKLVSHLEKSGLHIGRILCRKCELKN